MRSWLILSLVRTSNSGDGGESNLGIEEAPGVGDGRGGPACCSPWSCKELDITEQLNWTEISFLELQGLNTDFNLCTTSYQMALFVSSFLCL